MTRVNTSGTWYWFHVLYHVGLHGTWYWFHVLYHVQAIFRRKFISNVKQSPKLIKFYLTSDMTGSDVNTYIAVDGMDTGVNLNVLCMHEKGDM